MARSSKHEVRKDREFSRPTVAKICTNSQLI